MTNKIKPNVSTGTPDERANSRGATLGHVPVSLSQFIWCCVTHPCTTYTSPPAASSLATSARPLGSICESIKWQSESEIWALLGSRWWLQIWHCVTRGTGAAATNYRLRPAESHANVGAKESRCQLFSLRLLLSLALVLERDETRPRHRSCCSRAMAN